MDTINGYFRAFGFAGKDLEAVVDAFKLKTFKKNELLVQEGKISKHIGLVKSGMFQYFVIKDGEERTTYVNIANTWLASVMSFVSGRPAMENIRALTDGSICMISRADLMRLVSDVPAFKDFYIMLLEQSICGIDASRHDLIVLSAEQRYAKMLHTEQHLLQQIPLQHLASMLGVTPRHLSRIRQNIR